MKVTHTFCAMGVKNKIWGFERVCVVNDVFTYWWLIMSYQELIAGTVASLSTAWRPASGDWLHTLVQSLLSQYVPSYFICCFAVHSPVMFSIYTPFIALLRGLYSLRLWKYAGIWRFHGNDFLLWKLFWHPQAIRRLIHKTSQVLHVNVIGFIYLYICYNVCISLLFLLYLSFLFTEVTFTLLIWSSWLVSLPLSLSMHSPLHFAHAHCPASRPHTPPSISTPLQPLPLFYLWEYADGANAGKDRFFL